MSYQLWRAERNCNGARSMVAVFNDIFLWSLPHSGSFQKSVAPWAAVHWVRGSSWGGAHPAHSQLLAPGVSENPCHDALCLSFLLPSCFHSIYFTSGQYPIGWSLLFILAMHRWSHAGPSMPICAFVIVQFMVWLCAGESVLQAPCQHLASSIFLALRRAYLLPRNGKENYVSCHFLCSIEELFLWKWGKNISQLLKYSYLLEICSWNAQMKSFCLHILSFSQKCHCCGEASFITLLKCLVLISGLIWRLFQTWALWEKEMKVGSRVLCFWALGCHSGKCFYATNG